MTRSIAKPYVLLGIAPGRHAVIEASAGTGKTYTIEHLVLDLVLSGRAKLPEILVVTFTDKAAVELRLRIRRLLTDIARGKGRPPVPGGSSWDIDARGEERVREAVRDFERASIQTIHAFCLRVLRETAFAGGRPFELEQRDGRSSFREAAIETLRRLPAEDPEAGALIAWWTAAKAFDDIIDRLWEARRHAGNLAGVVEVRAVREAWRMVRSAAPAWIDEGNAKKSAMAAGITNGSSKAAAARALVAVARAAETLSDDAPIAAIAAALEDSRENLKKYFGDPTKSATAGPDLRALAGLAAATDSPLRLALSILLPPVLARWRATKRDQGFFDFEDMLDWVDEALRSTDGPRLAASLRDRFRCALIDEFQDTDPVQWEVFRRLFVDGKDRGELIVVGDPKQSIYAFRGADVHIYRSAKALLAEQNAAVLELEENFRSSRALIGAVNRILDPSAAAPFFSGKTRYDRAVRFPEQKDIALLGATGRPEAPVTLVRVVPPEGEKLVTADLKTAHARFIAAECRRLLEPGRFTVTDRSGTHPLTAREIYVLTATGQESRLAGAALADHGVRYAFFREGGLFATDEAADVLDLLEAVADPYDGARRSRALITPFFGIGAAAAARARDAAKAVDIVRRFEEFAELAHAGRFARLFESLFESTGATRRLLLFEAQDRLLTNYAHIFEILLRDARRERGGLEAVIDSLRRRRAAPELESTAGEDIQRLETDGDAVRVMTIHKSKGLEAAVVFLFGAFSGRSAPAQLRRYHDGRATKLFVGKPAGGSPEEIAIVEEESDEARRLYYVAITRAKAKLYLPFLLTKASGADDASKFNGRYVHLNARLEALAPAAGETSADGAFARRDIPLHEDDAAVDRPAAPIALAPSPAPELDFMALKMSARARIETSYSAIKARMSDIGHGGAGGTSNDIDRREAVAADPLPPGTETGILLHALLEEVEPGELEAAASLSTAAEATRRLFEDKTRAWGGGAGAPEAAFRAAKYALTTPIVLDQGAPLSLGRAPDLARELEFTMPYPELAHGALGAGWSTATRVERGYLHGFVDFVFSRDERVYLGDWKSDAVADASDTALRNLVLERYSIQIEVYTLALLRIAGIADRAAFERRFGGLVYVFLRALDGKTAKGFVVLRPSFDDVLGYEAKIRALEEAAAP